ncbi:MAG: MarR family transcriptional regulator [Candidatus Aenigmatarchaeota archaeon]|nr:MAG: MarR family transcriptional regulator [Candidatus Aenigmarchaeota archaeon]
MEIRKVLITTFAFLLVFQGSASAFVDYDVIIVRGDLPTDYTIASIYASTQKIPLVFVNPDSIQPQIKSELVGFREKGYQLMLIIGGESAISGSVEQELKDAGFIVNRLWDWNRYGTAARVAIDLWGESEEVVITNGEDYTGFLLAQHVALERGVPILFINNATVPDETRGAIRKLGATSAVLVSSESSAHGAVNSLGLNVETIETSIIKDAAEEQATLLDFYLVFSLAVIIVLAAVIILRFREGRGSIFLLTEDEEKIIEILKMHGKTEQNKLAHMTGFSKPRISRMLRSLEERGLIEREKFKKTFKIKTTPKIA